VPAAQRPEALLLLALMAGAVLAAAGLAGLGRYTRFVSYSVMIGFLTGISVNIACGQVADLTGAQAHGAFPLAKAIDVVIHPAGIDLASLLTGLAALAILVLLARTRIAMVSALIALVIPTAVVILAGASTHRLRRPPCRRRRPALPQRPATRPDRTAPPHRKRRRTGPRVPGDPGHRRIHPLGLPRRRGLAGQKPRRPGLALKGHRRQHRAARRARGPARAIHQSSTPIGG
jgi:hypothetical protein